MKIIADSGSTKTHWVVLSDNQIVNEFFTDGINPHFVDSNSIQAIVGEVISNDIRNTISKVSFYGSGCSGSEMCNIVNTALTALFPVSKIYLYNDLVASAKALFSTNSGVACILGTGSNAAVWNGDSFVRSIVSLGYVLGDEGSGAYIGRQLISDYFHKEVSDDVRSELENSYDMDLSNVLKNIYSEKYPNRYLAAFTKVLSANRGDSYVEILLENSFQAFIDFQLSTLEFDKNNLKVGFVGSVAFVFKDVLAKVLLANGYLIGDIYQAPMYGLLDWTRKKKYNY